MSSKEAKKELTFPRGRVEMTQPKNLLALVAALLLAALCLVCLVLTVCLRQGSAPVTVSADVGRNEVIQLIMLITCG